MLSVLKQFVQLQEGWLAGISKMMMWRLKLQQGENEIIRQVNCTAAVTSKKIADRTAVDTHVHMSVKMDSFNKP